MMNHQSIIHHNRISNESLWKTTNNVVDDSVITTLFEYIESAIATTSSSSIALS